jgi:hypothetical protein
VQAVRALAIGEGATRARQWHQASATLREATATKSVLERTCGECERVQADSVAEFERIREDTPYVAALWRECIRLGADSDTVRNCRGATPK